MTAFTGFEDNTIVYRNSGSTFFLLFTRRKLTWAWKGNKLIPCPPISVYWVLSMCRTLHQGLSSPLHQPCSHMLSRQGNDTFLYTLFPNRFHVDSPSILTHIRPFSHHTLYGFVRLSLHNLSQVVTKRKNQDKGYKKCGIYVQKNIKITSKHNWVFVSTDII